MRCGCDLLVLGRTLTPVPLHAVLLTLISFSVTALTEISLQRACLVLKNKSFKC